ncbi:GNAT family acetyltransferase [Hyella patelloides LEGE 07179]|uniref:GNAT family acetyltransferase n=1 Tax=Hyella patelloides LEGE 07179 TaxID=945734 RepID=A0A563VQU4_9CYAN|nr:GNAT family N-acetyltransferase [Hyella patelloides]VEP13745.1 GNAT family acetyltransferase [Hyella patelloides LEGE 07179]
MSIQIRQAESFDADLVTALVHDAYYPYITRLGKPPGPMLENYQEVINKNYVYVIEEQGSVLGLIVLKIAHPTFLLDNIAVHPSHQNKGIGKILLKTAEKKAIESGFDTITLYTHEKMSENINLYTHIGYREIRRVHENGYDRVYMSKNLDLTSYKRK